jgi:hypothetical protein
MSKCKGKKSWEPGRVYSEAADARTVPAMIAVTWGEKREIAAKDEHATRPAFITQFAFVTKLSSQPAGSSYQVLRS